MHVVVFPEPCSPTNMTTLGLPFLSPDGLLAFASFPSFFSGPLQRARGFAHALEAAPAAPVGRR